LGTLEVSSGFPPSFGRFSKAETGFWRGGLWGPQFGGAEGENFPIFFRKGGNIFGRGAFKITRGFHGVLGVDGYLFPQRGGPPVVFLFPREWVFNPGAPFKRRGLLVVTTGVCALGRLWGGCTTTTI